MVVRDDIVACGQIAVAAPAVSISNRRHERIILA
jgi:hypothetical protein